MSTHNYKLAFAQCVRIYCKTRHSYNRSPRQSSLEGWASSPKSKTCSLSTVQHFVQVFNQFLGKHPFISHATDTWPSQGKPASNGEDVPPHTHTLTAVMTLGSRGR